MLKNLSRRFVLASSAGAAGLALGTAGLAYGAEPATSGTSGLPTLAEVFAGDPGTLTVANYSAYVADRSKVNAARAEHQLYADSMRLKNRLLMGGPLLGADGRPSGVLLVYQVASKPQAEALVQNDPFNRHGAIADYRLNEWDVRERNVELLSASLVPEDGRTTSTALDARLYVNYVKFVSDATRVENVRAAHQSYAQTLKAQGKLVAAGPFGDGAGAMYIYRAQSKEEAMTLAAKDPYQAAGVVESSSLSEWRLFGLNAGLFSFSKR